jgi:hypothetical protein
MHTHTQTHTQTRTSTNIHTHTRGRHIQRCRLDIFHTDHKTEADVSLFLANLLRKINHDRDPKVKRWHYEIAGIEVCYPFFCRAYGVSQDKMVQIRAVAKNGGTIIVHGNEGRQKRPGRVLQKQIAFSFWHHFFDTNCQRPTMHVSTCC